MPRQPLWKFSLFLLIVLLGSPMPPAKAGPGRSAQEPVLVEASSIQVVRAAPESSTFRLAAPLQANLLQPKSAEISYVFLENSTNAFGSYCYPWPAELKPAFERAASIW
jgi:hypothetical protein